MPQGTTGDVVAVHCKASRVLFTPKTSSFTEVTRVIEVVRRVPSHAECVLADFSSYNTEYIRTVGFGFRLLAPYFSEEEGRLALDFDQGHSLRHPLAGEMLTRRVTSERALLRSSRPDVVVIGVIPSQLISARAEYVPLAFARPLAYSLMHLEAVRVAGATSLLSRTPPEGCLIDNATAHVLHVLETRFPLLHSFHSVAKASDVSPPQEVLSGLIADLNLIATVLYLFSGWLRMSQGHRVVGPVHVHLSGELPEFLADLAAGPQSLVYFTTGSSGSCDPVPHVLAGLGRTGCQVLAPVRSYLRQEDLKNLLHNVRVTD